tara:strand:+ start:1338 stop:1634 length:297 start_codon:yes stop_codon:yes gene_type:complete
MKLEKNKVYEFLKRHNWSIELEFLYKKYIFSNFSSAISFINEIANISEEKDHHPKLVNNYNIVEVFWITNDVGYITEKDIELAKNCDKTYLNYSKNEI